jgi:hypothetical protein
MSEDVRAEVNRLVYDLAKFGCDVRAVERLGRLRELGFGELVARVEERLQTLVEIRTFLIEESNPIRVGVVFPKLESQAAWDALLVDLRRIPGRRYCGFAGMKAVNSFPRTRETFVAWRMLLARHFPGRVVQGLKGLYVVQPIEGERTAAA